MLVKHWLDMIAACSEDIFIFRREVDDDSYEWECIAYYDIIEDIPDDVHDSKLHSVIICGYGSGVELYLEESH